VQFRSLSNSIASLVPVSVIAELLGGGGAPIAWGASALPKKLGIGAL
jgi:hypothetical protein